MAGIKGSMGNGQDPIAFLRSGKANFVYERFSNFWNENVSIGFYITELLKYYNECEKAKKSSGISIESTISTLYFLVLSGCYDPNDAYFKTAFEEARQRWDYHRQNHESFNPVIDEIITSILNIPVSPDEHIHLVFSHSLTFPLKIASHLDISYTNYFGQVFKVTNPQDIQTYQAKGFTYLSPNPAFCILDKGEFILTYSYLKAYINIAGYIPLSILDLFHRKIQEIIINLRTSDYKLAQSTLLPLLYMLENLLITFPIISYDSMDALIIDLDILRRWPLPYGAAADKLLKIILNELKSPGSAIRYRLREEFPLIDVHLPIFEKTDYKQYKAKGFIVLDSSETIESSNFFMISSFNNKFCQEKIYEMVKKVENYRPVNMAAVIAHVNRCLIILFAFSLYVELTTVNLTKIAGLSTKSVFGLYKRIVQMVEKIENEEMDRARTLQEWFVLELYEELASLESDRTSPLTEPLLVYLSEFDIYFPKVPMHSLSVIDLNQGHQSDTFEAEYLINQSNALVIDDPIFEIIKQSTDISDISQSFPIKIILTGSDSITHKFVKNYVYTMENNKLCSQLNIRFYCIPTFQVNNTLSVFLASIDPWYTRHIYLPFFFRPWLPRLDIKADSKKMAKKDPNFANLTKSFISDPSSIGPNEKSLPIMYSEIMMQDYLTEATRILPINIYKVTCFKFDLSHAEDIFPMCMYIDIGVSAAAKRFQELNTAFKDKSISEVLESKSFRFRFVQLQLQMSQMDLLGNLCGIDESVVKNIYNLSIGNVPRENDKGMAPVPQAEWLELSFIEREAADQEANLLKGIKSKKVKEPQSNLNIAINSLYSNLHVASGKILALENMDFDIIIDGALYGPYRQIVIEPWLGGNSSQLVIPITTFLDSEG